MTGLKDTPPYFRDADRRTLLQKQLLFSKLSPRHIDRLAAALSGNRFLARPAFFARGDPGSSLFAICQGTVKISVPSVDGMSGVQHDGQGDISGDCPARRPRALRTLSHNGLRNVHIERRISCR